ncbi:hypothetical protein LTR33_000328 [Friedmanniomyces endolithicus]|nr:hypothetical protein LTR33_000328 [Friedmanniomyces endolithicus]
MDSSLGLLKFLFPQIPGLANTALWHTLGQLETSSKWDLRTTLTVQVLRQMMQGGGKKPSPISKVQASTLKDPGIKGKIWVAKATVAAPKPADESLREAVFRAIDEMKGAEVQYTKPDLVDTEVEWTGFRPDAGKDEPLPDISEKGKYERLMSEPTRTSGTTLLYFHGGAYWLCAPSTHRQLTSRLAKETHGRVCSVKYRLAPQAAFPSQLIDALMMYLSLLYPPPGSMHEAVLAKEILFAGDSAGGNIVFALLQLLLQLHRTSNKPTLRLPTDTEPRRSMTRFPHEDIWPATPPRGDLFCDLSLLDHPLVSPLSATSWKGSPPLWLCTGQEGLTDEDCFVASRAASEGVVVQFEQYEAMPHCFAMLMPFLPTGDRCLRSWGDFCRRCVEEPASVETNGTYVYAKTGAEKAIDVAGVSKMSLDEVKKLMAEAKEKRLKGYEKEGKGMPKPAL